MSSATESNLPGYHFLFEVDGTGGQVHILVRASDPGGDLELAGVLTVNFEVYVMLRAMLAVGATPLEEDVEVRWIEDDIVRKAWTDYVSDPSDHSTTPLHPNE